MSAAFTPGPWKMSSANTVHGPDCVVCYVGTDNREVRRFAWPRQKADARLICAAPELLDALEELLHVQQSVTRIRCDAVGDTYDDAIDRAKSAIAKAKGAA